MDTLYINFNFSETYLINNFDALQFKNYRIIEALNPFEYFCNPLGQIAGTVQFIETKSEDQFEEFETLKRYLTPKSPQKRQYNTSQNSPRPRKIPSIEGGSFDYAASSGSGRSAFPPPKTQMFVEAIVDGQRTYMCTLCAYKTTYNSSIHSHGRRAHGDNFPSFSCRTCDFSTPEKKRLKSHYMRVHNLDEIIAKGAVDISPLG